MIASSVCGSCGLEEHTCKISGKLLPPQQGDTNMTHKRLSTGKFVDSFELTMGKLVPASICALPGVDAPAAGPCILALPPG